MKLYVIRHTKVDVEKGICYGQSDLKPAKSFNNEVNKIIPQIKDVSFNALYSSPLYRCSELSKKLFPNSNINYDNKLKELNFGDWELKKWDTIYELEYGKMWFNNYFTLPTPNGESFKDLLNRVQKTYQNILKKHSSGNIALITHSGVIKTLKIIIENTSQEIVFNKFNPSYGSITVWDL